MLDLARRRRVAGGTGQRGAEVRAVERAGISALAIERERTPEGDADREPTRSEEAEMMALEPEEETVTREAEVVSGPRNAEEVEAMPREPEKEAAMWEPEEETAMWRAEEETITREPGGEAEPAMREPERAEVVNPAAKHWTVETPAVMEPAIMESAGRGEPAVMAPPMMENARCGEPAAVDSRVPADAT